MPVFRRRSAGATDGTAQDSPGAQSPDDPAETKPRSPAEAAKGRPTPKRSVAEAKRRQPIAGSSRAPAGPSGLCAPGESWDVPSVAPALRRRNTGSSLSGGTGVVAPEASRA